MAQVKIYGLRSQLSEYREGLSAAIHDALMVAFGLPEEKKFQRFLSLDGADFIFPADRSDAYTIIEISIFEGRSAAAKKTLISRLFANIEKQCGIRPQDVEITLFETPMNHWGIRGVPADELALNYQVKV